MSSIKSDNYKCISIIDTVRLATTVNEITPFIVQSEKIKIWVPELTSFKENLTPDVIDSSYEQIFSSVFYQVIMKGKIVSYQKSEGITYEGTTGLVDFLGEYKFRLFSEKQVDLTFKASFSSNKPWVRSMLKCGKRVLKNKHKNSLKNLEKCFLTQ